MSSTNRLLLVIAAVFLLGCSTGDPYVPEEDPVLIRANRLAGQRNSLVVVAEEHTGAHVYPNIENFLESPRPMLALYREDLTRARVVDFFVDLTGSDAVAMPILYYADRLDISFSLAFSIAYVESRYTPLAVNHNSTSVDRGLFQLNSRTFRHLSEDDFFNPEINTFHGLKHLEFCLNVAQDDAEALAIYNAGYVRVARGNTPRLTLAYVRLVLEYRDSLLARFHDYILSHFPPSIA